jgi:hypothetical protein
MTYETDNEYRAQVAAWVARHVDTPVDRRIRPGTWTLDEYVKADHAEARAVNETRA